MKRRAGLLAALSLCLSAGIAQAQNLNFYDTMSGANFVQWWQTHAVPACQAEAHATIHYASGGSAEVLQRVKAAPAGKGDIDVLFLAPDKIVQFKNEGVLVDLRQFEKLIPNLAKTQPPDNTVAAGAPLDGTGAEFFRYVYTLIYNSDTVKNPPHTYKELFERRDEWKGHISYVDPRSTVSGAGRFFVAMFLRAFGSDLKLPDDKEDATWAPGWEKLTAFEKANAPKHAESGGAHMAQLATGEIWIGFHALDFTLYSQKLGTLPPAIRTVLMEDGTPGGAGYLAIPKNIPEASQQAAARFINCALSDKVQVDMVSEMYEFPGTNVWTQVPESVYKVMPSEKTLDTARAPDPPAEALTHISKAWAQKLGY
jgi:ABC-type uncharacterized transport system YnjBCD substrate-binding protein